MPHTIRELKSISIRKLKGLTDVTIDFGDKDHRITGIFGLNGSGKTTVLHTIMCIYKQIHNPHISIPSEYVANTRMSRYFKHVGNQYWQDSDYSVTYMYETVNAVGERIYAEETDKKKFKKYYHPNAGRRMRSEWTPRERAKHERYVYYIPLKSCIPDIEEIQSTNATIRVDNDATDINRAQQICAIASQIMGKHYEIVNRVGTSFIKHSCYNVRTTECGQYHSLSMGAGEQRLFRILEVLFNAPNNALIVIDEIDLTLHTAALRELFSQMQRLAQSKKLQIVFTSHRQEIMDFPNVNVRYLINTGRKTFCIDNPTTQCYEQLTGKTNTYLKIFVEDEMSKCIVEKILMKYKLKRHAQIIIYGAVSNAIPIASALEIQLPLNDVDQRRNILFVLDGDVYQTDEQKQNQINKILSGNGDEIEQRRRNVLRMLSQYASIASVIQQNKNMCPEEYIYNAIIELPENNGNPEIVDAARSLGVVVDPHDYINKLEENYDIHDIVNVFISNNEKWESYTRMVDSWISARKIEFDRERIIVEQ